MEVPPKSIKKKANSNKGDQMSSFSGTSCLTDNTSESISLSTVSDCGALNHLPFFPSLSSPPHFEGTSWVSKAQPYDNFTGKNDEYGVVSRVPTSSTGTSSFTVEGNRFLDIEAKSSEFNNALMESSKLLLEQLLQLIPFHVVRVIDSQGNNPYGRAIIDKNSGLPLICKFVEKALRMDDSMDASLSQVRGLLSTKTLHQVLNFGYTRLKEEDIDSCFLYSALSTASRADTFSSLVDSMIDEGLISGSITDARQRGHDIIKHLIDLCFLECTDDGLMVKVHDLICDMALELLSDVQNLHMLLSRYTIGLQKNLLGYSSNSDYSERNKSILKACEGLTEPPSEEEWEEANMVILMDNKLSSLPKSPTCSKLLTLFLQRNSCLRSIPPNFFDNMSSLTILNLSKTRIKSLTRSLSKLVCLQVLILRNCERLLHLPSEIGGLKNLKVLDVHGTEICKLPDEIGELLSLVHLQVCFYGSMDEDEITMLPSQLISKGLISRLAHLKKLSITVYPRDKRWTDIALDITTEVHSLELCSLTFYFPEINHLNYFIQFSRSWMQGTLTYFNFVVGHDVKRIVSHVSHELEHEYNHQDKCIRFVDGEVIPNAIKEVLSRARAFYLDHHLTAHSLTQFELNAINHLKFCIVSDCPKLESVINSKTITGECFPLLEFLSVHYCWNLSQIWVGPIRAGSLSTLRRLSVHCCPKLEFVLSRSMVDVLVKLEELIIEDCRELKNIIDGYSSTETDQMEVDLAMLQLKVLKLHYLPKLENIWNDGGDFPCLEDLSVYDCPILKKLNLKSRVEETIKKIKVDMAWWRDLEWDDLALPDKLEHCVEEINGDDIWGTK